MSSCWWSKIISWLNVEACFILSGISFRNLFPKLDIVSVPKCTVWCFYQLNVYHSINCIFLFLENSKLLDRGHLWCTSMVKVVGALAWKTWVMTSLVILEEIPAGELDSSSMLYVLQLPSAITRLYPFSNRKTHFLQVPMQFLT